MLRLWAVVLAANLVGTFLFAWLLSVPGLFDREITEALSGVANDLLKDPFWPMAIKSMLAGWLIALMVWLMPSAGQSRLLLILIITYTVAIAHFSHLIAGSVEAAYLVVTGQIGPGDYITHFFLPTFLGNTIGGTSLVALLNHAPVREELDEEKSKASVEARTGPGLSRRREAHVMRRAGCRDGAGRGPTAPHRCRSSVGADAHRAAPLRPRPGAGRPARRASPARRRGRCRAAP